MNREDFLKTVGLGAMGIPLGTGISSAPKSPRVPGTRPNILFITTDYQAAEDLPASGSPFLRMPNVDRLCREGVVCDNYYCTAPICTPARYTLITGQYPHTHGQWDNTGRWVPEESPLLMQTLHEGGYQTVGIGKMHFHPWERMAGFDHRITADRKGNGKYDNQRKDDYARFLEKHRLSRWSYLQKQWQTDLFGVYDWPYDERFHIDYFVGEQAVQFIKNHDLETPWFNWVSFNGPHNPWDPPAKYSDPYKRMELPSARARPGELANKPADHTRLRYNYTRAVVDRLDQAEPEQKKKLIGRIRAGHYGGLSFIDHQIGRILEALNSTGQRDNTVIIYSADHGCQLGDHHNIHKGLFYERSASVPFVVWYPGRFKPRRIESYGGHVDFFPTILSLAGISMSEDLKQKLEGQDLSSVLEGRTEADKQEEFLEIRHGTSLVTDRWKYSVYPRDGHGELYDRQNDPDELYNLFDDAGYSSICREMQDRLVAFHPPLADQIVGMRPIASGFRSRKRWRLKPGQRLSSRQAPYQQDKQIRVEADLGPSVKGRINGPLLVATVADVHGYALYLHEERLELAVRRWGEDTVIISPVPLPDGRVQVGATITKTGRLTLFVDGEEVSAGKVKGGLPSQPGRKRVLAPVLHAGHSPGWPEPMGDYEPGTNFGGAINSLTLRVE